MTKTKEKELMRVLGELEGQLKVLKETEDRIKLTMYKLGYKEE